MIHFNCSPEKRYDYTLRVMLYMYTGYTWCSMMLRHVNVYSGGLQLNVFHV